MVADHAVGERRLVAGALASPGVRPTRRTDCGGIRRGQRDRHVWRGGGSRRCGYVGRRRRRRGLAGQCPKRACQDKQDGQPPAGSERRPHDSPCGTATPQTGTIRRRRQDWARRVAFPGVRRASCTTATTGGGHCRSPRRLSPPQGVPCAS
ncbi:hypothetical protein ATSB10_17400 [Dyella thiooxydans]|uniref:Uncharacterized protein n=1 Tax=Dyella thiooxydans TaxID=445710 RepID=A0A160N132_9GAMM|nr:hypothetical protein ATSB10_17400 [Dyella thiooxydans]